MTTKKVVVTKKEKVVSTKPLMKLAKVRATLTLLNSMLKNGETHCDISVKSYKESLAEIDSLM